MSIPARTRARATGPGDLQIVTRAYQLLDRYASRPALDRDSHPRRNRRNQRLRQDAPPDREILHPVNNTARNVGLALDPSDAAKASWPGQLVPGGHWWGELHVSADAWRRANQAASHLAFHRPQLLEHPEVLLDLVESAIPGESTGDQNRREDLRRSILQHWRSWTHTRRELCQRGGHVSGRRRKEAQYLKLLRVAQRMRQGFTPYQVRDALGYPLSSVYRFFKLVIAAQGLDPRLDLRVPGAVPSLHSHERTSTPQGRGELGTSVRDADRGARSATGPSSLSALLAPTTRPANRRSLASLRREPRPPPPRVIRHTGHGTPLSTNAGNRTARATGYPASTRGGPAMRPPCRDCGDTGWMKVEPDRWDSRVTTCHCRARRARPPEASASNPPATKKRRRKTVTDATGHRQPAWQPPPRAFPPPPCGKDAAVGSE